MKAYWGSGDIATCIIDLGTRWRWVVRFTPRQLYPQGSITCYPLDRRLDGPQGRSGRGAEDKNSQPLPGLVASDHPTHSPALYHWAILVVRVISIIHGTLNCTLLLMSLFFLFWVMTRSQNTRMDRNWMTNLFHRNFMGLLVNAVGIEIVPQSLKYLNVVVIYWRQFVIYLPKREREREVGNGVYYITKTFVIRTGSHVSLGMHVENKKSVSKKQSSSCEYICRSTGQSPRRLWNPANRPCPMPVQ
jgi:hypothetical protein